MIAFVKNIKDFWSQSLDSYTYARQTAYADMKNGKDWHDNFKTGTLQQSFGAELPDFYSQFVTDLGLNTDVSVVSWICMQPGQFVAPHYDTFYQLLKSNNDQYSIDQCLRYLVFLQDWQLGQLVDSESATIKHWKQGDVWVMNYQEQHWACNASNSNFHTCQVNTINQGIAQQ
jgi:hypothetical protein